MIYFDNAATGGFKPYAPQNAAISAMKYLLANPGRSGHRLSVAGAEIVWQARETLAEFFHSDAPERVIFTKNCTEALNTAIFGILQNGDHVIVSEAEHNSVLRPLYHLQESGTISLTILPVEKFRPVRAEDVEKAIRKRTRLCCLSHASNVTGDRIDLSAISTVLRRENVLFLVDAAQSAGHTRIDVNKSGIDVLAVAGHKGMYGIPGSGALLFNKRTEIRPLLFGGTGSMSFSPRQPSAYPEKLESGTLNLPAIASLMEGARYLTSYMDGYSGILYAKTADLIKKLSEFPRISPYSMPNEFGIVSFDIKGLPSQEAADIFSEKYDIAVRGGYHCAPLMHKALKTEENGLVRVSLSVHNTDNEVTQFLEALKEMQK